MFFGERKTNKNSPHLVQVVGILLDAIVLLKGSESSLVSWVQLLLNDHNTAPIMLENLASCALNAIAGNRDARNGSIILRLQNVTQKKKLTIPVSDIYVHLKESLLFYDSFFGADTPEIPEIKDLYLTQCTNVQKVEKTLTSTESLKFYSDGLDQVNRENLAQLIAETPTSKPRKDKKNEKYDVVEDVDDDDYAVVSERKSNRKRKAPVSSSQTSETSKKTKKPKNKSSKKKKKDTSASVELESLTASNSDGDTTFEKSAPKEIITLIKEVTSAREQEMVNLLEDMEEQDARCVSCFEKFTKDDSVLYCRQCGMAHVHAMEFRCIQKLLEAASKPKPGWKCCKCKKPWIAGFECLSCGNRTCSNGCFRVKKYSEL